MTQERKPQTATKRREAGPGMPEQKAGVPAVREGHTVPAELSVARQAAELATTKWGNLMDLPVEQAEVLFGALHKNFPDLGPIELNAGFCLLGGSTIYDKGEFWLNRLAQEDRCVGKPQCHPIEPGTPLWERYMRDQEPDAIAAASLCRLEKLEITGEIREYEDANYCATDDEILFGLSYVTVPEAKSKQEALKLAEGGHYYGGEHLPEDAALDGWAKQDYGEWKVRFRFRYPDYKALARLAADTRAARRVGKRAFPMVARDIDYAIKHLQAVLEQQAQLEGAKEERAYVRREAEAEDPYATPEEVEAQVKEQAPVPAEVTRPVKVDEQPASEANVKSVYKLLTDRVGAGKAHQTFKRMIADARGLAADDEKVLEGINPHDITVAEWRKVVEMVDRIPTREQEPIEEVEAVDQQEEMPL